MKATGSGWVRFPRATFPATFGGDDAGQRAMFTRILVPFDGSAESNVALPLAGALAEGLPRGREMARPHHPDQR